MPPLNVRPGGRGRAYWRSLDHLADTPEFRQFMFHEFPAGAADLLESDDRRHFLKIMGASMALAGLGMAGCRRWPDEEIVPYASRPPGRDPGIPVRFATGMEIGGVVSGLLVTSHDGRPTKVEGNPEHPTSRGAATRFAQASVLDLYDPDRSRTVVRGSPGAEGDGEAGEGAADWASFVAWADQHFKTVRGRRGRGLAVLAEASSSPSRDLLRQQFLATFPNATWHEYEPISNDAEVEGAERAFGRPYRTQLDLAAARVVVSLDADILGEHPNAVENIRGFAASRRAVDDGGPARGEMSRLYAFESDLSLTGANADERAAVRSAEVGLVAAAIAARITGDAALRGAAPEVAALGSHTASVVEHVVADLRAHGSHAVVVAGARQPAEVHYLAHLLNDAIGAVGSTVWYTGPQRQEKHVASLRALVAMGDAVDTLLILGGNPVYDAPADLDFQAFIAGVDDTIHLSHYVDETSQACAWHVNRAHYLETWGDGRSWDGTYTPSQPLIEPLFQGRSPIELLALLSGDQLTSGRAIVQRTFAEMIGGEDDRAWRTTLHDGRLSMVPDADPPTSSAYTRETPSVDRSGMKAAVDAIVARGSGSGYEIVFAPDPTVYDGRYANNGWLQETPDPISKLVWDNAALMSPATARGLGVDPGDMVTITAGGRTLDVAAWIQPGLAEGCITLHLGYGRGFEGRIAAGAGFDAYRLRTSDAMGFATGATVTKAAGRFQLASTQDHHAIDVETIGFAGAGGVKDRLPSLFREADLPEYREHPDFAAHRTHVVHRLSQWAESNLDEGRYAWGMAIDLNSCVGCGACIVACQAENNIPIVGKDQVLRGREMHWLRVDRFFRFAEHEDETGTHVDGDDVDAVALQPVVCMHCENAPCEQVCPVAATVHDEDGLNVMVYNRCIGTRYCSNNCPYKVRRFNYFDFHRRDPHRESPGTLLQVETTYWGEKQATPDDLTQLQFNPEVTVRMRGVMEKCTYCVQRIADGKIQAKNAHARQTEAAKAAAKDQRVPVPDGAITPACAQTCPAEAITFGDLNDPGSRVTERQRHPRAFEMLEELNVDARTKYMAKIRNPVDGAAHGGGGHA